MRKKILALLLALSLCAGLSVPALAATTFTDVPANHVFYDTISRAASAGWLNGYEDSTYRPTATLQNSHIGVIFARCFYPEDVAEYEAAADSAKPWWWANFMAGDRHGLFAGTSFDKQWTSRSKMAATRYDMAQMIFNVMEDYGFTVSAADRQRAQASISDWDSIELSYRDAVSSCVALGIINGYSGGEFRGEAFSTRGAASAVLCRTYDAIAAGGGSVTEPEAVEPVTPPVEEEPVTPPVVDEPDPVTPSSNIPADYNGDGKLTEDEVLRKLEELKSKYPDNGTYDPNTRYTMKGTLDGGIATGRECAKLAYMITDEIFGDLPARSHTDITKIRPGDMTYTSMPHWMVATSTVVKSDMAENYYNFSCVSGGPTGFIDWVDRTGKYNDGKTVIYTRYPK